jgi:hypothetical protein
VSRQAIVDESLQLPHVSGERIVPQRDRLVAAMILALLRCSISLPSG